MLIQFSVSNFLSFNEKATLSMVAGKARKHAERIYSNKKTKLTKCEVILGANASGKSNLISAIDFFQSLVLDGLPRGFSNKFFRLHPDNKSNPSEFELIIQIGSQIFCYGFSIILSTGSIVKEYLYEITSTDKRKQLFERDTAIEKFIVGPYFKKADTIAKLNNYGEDSSSDKETLFLTIMNKSKGKMFGDFPELRILRDIYAWFAHQLIISFPESSLTDYPFFSDSNLKEIVDILNALGTGIGELKIIEVPFDMIKSKVPEGLYRKIVADLEKENALAEDDERRPKGMLRSYKEFYTLEIDRDNKVTIKTIEFSHENKTVFFDLNEESDGTARLLDLVEILLKASDNRVYIIDEIDRCLHPAMTVKVIDLFLEMAKTRNTQLIITSHESRLLASDILRNDEICFANKNSRGESIIKSLEGYQLRADKKIYAALFDGTLDAAPVFDDKKLKNILDVDPI